MEADNVIGVVGSLLRKTIQEKPEELGITVSNGPERQDAKPQLRTDRG